MPTDSKLTQAERERRILDHIEAALALKPRDSKHRPLKSLLSQARDAVIGKARQSDSPTDLEYRNASAGSKLTDPNRAGLLMRVGKRSGRQWIFRHVHPTTHKQTEIVFGTYPDTTLSEARDIWSELREARNAGQDPKVLLDARQIQSATGGGMTMSELVERYLSDYVFPRKKPRSAAEDERLLRKHVLTNYSEMPAAQFGPDQVAAILRPYIHDKPNTAAKIRIVINTMFDTATGKNRRVAKLGVSDTWLPGELPNPTRDIILPPFKAQSHKPTQREMEKFLELLPTLPGQNARILTLLAQTMCRISEVTELPWSELDIDRKHWNLQAKRTKNGSSHLILLSEQSTSMLRRIKADQNAHGISSPYVFPQISNLQKPTTIHAVESAFRKRRTHAGLPETFKLHSLRHYALSWLAERGQGRDLRDRMSNHKPPNTADAIYVNASLNDQASEWWQNYANHLDGLAAGIVVNQ